MITTVLLDSLDLWIDPTPRPGPEAMAVDEWLLEHVNTPTLRVYDWMGEWGSLGYFGELSEARSSIPGVSWVRRWSGGGIVDHRNDWTYTLVLPKQPSQGTLKSSEIYCAIHGALATALGEESIQAKLSQGDHVTGSSICFQNPVCHDLVDRHGLKIAGAGQRRTPHGVMHQGSLAAITKPGASKGRAERLAAQLAQQWQHSDIQPNDSLIQTLASSKYADSKWTEKRL